MPILKALAEEDHPELEGLLLVGAEEVNTDSNENPYTTNLRSSRGMAFRQHNVSKTMNIWAAMTLVTMFLVNVTYMGQQSGSMSRAYTS